MPSLEEPFSTAMCSMLDGVFYEVTAYAVSTKASVLALCEMYQLTASTLVHDILCAI